MMELDMDMVKQHIGRNISVDEALADKSPMEWPDDVLSGEKKAVVTGASRIGEASVKLDIEYN